MSNNTSLPKGTIQKARSQLQEKIKKEQQERHKNTYHDKENHIYYGKKAWKELRNSYIADHPVCEIHLKYDIYKPATEVHHKYIWSHGKTEEDKWRLLLDPMNLMSLCTECHKEVHNIARMKGLSYIDDCEPIELKEI